MNEQKFTLTVRDDGEVKFDLLDLIKSQPEEQQNIIAEFLGWELILEHLDRHLKGESEFSSWDTSGYRGGAKIREHIEKIQGTGDQRTKDLEDRIRSLERSEKNYKAYYDWYFKLYHHDYDLHRKIVSEIGEPIKETK